MQCIENSGIFTPINHIKIRTPNMKRHFFYTIILAIFSILILSACKKEPQTPTDAQMYLSVFGGTSFEVIDGDVTKTILINCSSPAQEDILVNIESGATSAQAELSASQVTIKKGTKTAEAKITFKLAAFPENTQEKIILVKITTRTQNVGVKESSTEFTVGGYTPLILTAKANNTEFNTFNADATLTVTFTLSKPLDSALGIQVSLGTETSSVFSEFFKEIQKIEIKGGETTATQTFTVPQGTDGVLQLAIETPDMELDEEIGDITATFTSEEIVN